MATFPLLFIFFLMTGSASSASISNMLRYGRFSGRFLLQEIEVAACPVDFEHKNYTALSRHCNESNFQSDKCCSAFKELTCPYWELLSDTKFNCASTLFGYINLYSNNTSDPISDLCREDENGLDCATVLNGSTPTTPTKTYSGAGGNARSSMVIVMAVLLQLVFHLF